MAPVERYLRCVGAALLLLFAGACSSLGDGFRVMSYNTWYVFAEASEVENGTAWIAEKAPDVVALQELTNISDARLAELAAGWGHEHSALLKTSGFSVGLTSSSPIEVVERMLDGLHHGCLHARVAGTDVFVVHLSPFQWAVREAEARKILSKVRPLLDDGGRVLVLGDFNALSPDDLSLLEAQPDLLAKMRASDEKHGHVENLRDGRCDVAVMQMFFDAGLVDVHLPFLRGSEAIRWTFTTGIWTEEKRDAPAGGSRIDYVLASPSLAARAIAAEVVRDGVVNRISDHYPVVVDFAR